MVFSPLGTQNLWMSTTTWVLQPCIQNRHGRLERIKKWKGCWACSVGKHSKIRTPYWFCIQMCSCSMRNAHIHVAFCAGPWTCSPAPQLNEWSSNTVSVEGCEPQKLNALWNSAIGDVMTWTIRLETAAGWPKYTAWVIGYKIVLKEVEILDVHDYTANFEPIWKWVRHAFPWRILGIGVLSRAWHTLLDLLNLFRDLQSSGIVAWAWKWVETAAYGCSSYCASDFYRK